MAIIPSYQRLGEILVTRGVLQPEDVSRILAYQVTHSVRFGEAAVALGLADGASVQIALAHQFGYFHTTPDRRRSSPELTILHQPNGLYAESIRATRAQLLLRAEAEFRCGRSAPRTLAVVSADFCEGRTRLVANLAVALAQSGRRTLVIDSDLRAPRQHQVFGLSEVGNGLSTILGKIAASDTSSTVTLTPIQDMASLFLLPSQPAPVDPLEQLENPNLSALLSQLSQQFEHILLDTPAYAAGPDVLTICARCDAALLVVRPQHTRTRRARALVEALQRSHTLILGTVIHDF